ncbi:MAG: glycosyltransferase family 1 protein [Bryobacterales bacterium]|nr:glycosyltransferase family 1 protein [Bryobacterales bacterium]
MARFLVTCWPFVGHLYPQVSVALALRNRGHEVAFYTHESARSVVEGEGFRLFPFVRVDERRYERIHALEAEVPATQPARQTLSVAMAAYRDMLAGSIPEQVSDLQPILERWRPNVLITDPALWGPILVLWELTGVPVALLTQMIGSMIPGPDAPPWGPGLPSPRSLGTRLLARAAQLGIDLVARGMRRRVNAIRAGYGLGPMAGSVNQHTGRLPLYLIPSVRELDYNRRDQPNNVHYIGPCVWTKSVGVAPPEWLNHLRPGRPWIHATEGTAQYQKPFLLRAVARALSDVNAEVILTTGQNRDPAALGLEPLPANVRIAQWLSHEEFLPKCAALVTTGGAATVLASLQASVPLLVVPTFWDKSDNAQRVVEAGAGLRIAPRTCTPKRVRAAVMRLIEEPSFRENAHRIALRFRQAQGPPRAAELLEGLANRSPSNAGVGVWPDMGSPKMSENQLSTKR